MTVLAYFGTITAVGWVTETTVAGWFAGARGTRAQGSQVVGHLRGGHYRWLGWGLGWSACNCKYGSVPWGLRFMMGFWVLLERGVVRAGVGGKGSSKVCWFWSGEVGGLGVACWAGRMQGSDM